MTVPAVTDVWVRHCLHSKTLRVEIHEAARPAQRGQMNPSGHRESARYWRQASSVENWRWNSRTVRGKPGRGIF